MGPKRIVIMRAFGYLIASLLALGCLSALDENIEAGQSDFTDFNEVTRIPKTEVAEVVLPTLRERSTSLTQAGTKTLGSLLPSPTTREKGTKKDKAFADFKKRKEGWIKSQAEQKVKQEKKKKAEKHAKEKKAKAEKHAKEKKAKAQKREKKAKEKKSKEKKSKENKRKEHVRERKTKEHKAKESKAKEKKAKEKKAKQTKADEKKAKESKSKKKPE